MKRHARALAVLAASSVLMLDVSATDSLPPIVDRFLAQGSPVVSYRGVRRLFARNQRFKLEGWVEAEVSLSPEAGFTFLVLREGGSGAIRSRVLRRALQTEQGLVATGRVREAALTLENYEFVVDSVATPSGTDGLVAVALRPRRRDQLLMDGRMLLDGADDLVRVEGRLAKNPSFWTSEVQIVRHYARIAGQRVARCLESTASVRFAGTSTMVMTYEYTEINGVLVSVPPQAASPEVDAADQVLPASDPDVPRCALIERAAATMSAAPASSASDGTPSRHSTPDAPSVPSALARTPASGFQGSSEGREGLR